MIFTAAFLHSEYLSNIAAISGSQMIFNYHSAHMIFFIVFALTFVVQLFYYLYYYLAAALHRDTDLNNMKDPPVSVIICARNEEENLKSFLPSVLDQDYPDYEVIVVNDCSEDETYDILGEYLKKYPNLKVSNISKDPKFTHNKKFAQFIGIKAAKNEFLIFTDADCRPESNKWLHYIAAGFNDTIDFVLGYGGYFSEKGLLNKYIRYDSMVIAMQYFGMTIRRAPYMGVGRNLAYRRSMFFSKKGFGRHTHLASGDDDLFVNDNGSGDNCAVECRKESHTRSVPAKSYNSYFKQKKRHFSTANHYRYETKILLIAEPLSRILFYLSFVFLLSQLFLWPFVLSIFAVRIIVRFSVLYLIQAKLNERGLLLYLPIFDIISPFINTVFYIGSLRQSTGKDRWK